jgi:hypothetical protein
VTKFFLMLATPFPRCHLSLLIEWEVRGEGLLLNRVHVSRTC